MANKLPIKEISMNKKRSSLDKFKEENELYFKERKQAEKETGIDNLFEIVDQFGLYAGVQTIGKVLAAYELIKQVFTVPGNIFEFGCWKGNNLLIMAKILQLLQPNTIKEIYGFDSFEGLQSFSKEDEIDSEARGRYCGNEENLRRFIKLYKMEDWVHLIVGDAMKTIKEFDEENDHFLISLAYIDFDLYEPTKEALKFIQKRISVGGIIVFDEAMMHEWKGEGRALLEFLEENDGKYETSMIPFVRQPTVILKKVR